jgi:hypothetical protein
MKQFLFIILITISVSGFAKSRPVFLENELDSAMIVQYAVILDYQKTTLKLQLSKTGDIIECNVYSKLTKIENYQASGLTGTLPIVGETILVVIDKYKRLSLIAKQIDNEMLRVWSPIETGSIAMFYFKAPVKPIPNEKGLELDNSDYLTCWDGCLFPIDNLMTK